MTRRILYLLLILVLLAGCTKEPGDSKEGKVIVLMYHRITEGEAANLYERSAANFESDLIYLEQNNIQVINFSDLEELVQEGVAPSNDCAIITFDDGDHSWLTQAMPLLIKHEMCATFFLWTLMIESDRDSFLSWDDVEIMSHYYNDKGRRPFTFGSHTLYHQYLYERKIGMNDPVAFAAYLDEELGGSRNLILPHTPEDVSILSLPFGDGAGDADIISGAERNGYKFIRTSAWGAIDIENADLMQIPSLPMLDNTDPALIGTYLGIE